jgi:hypothetical protein
MMCSLVEQEFELSAHLTLYVHDLAIAAAAGERFELATLQGVGADLGTWTRVQGLNLEWEVVDYSAATARGIGTRLQNARVLRPPHDCHHCITGASVIFVDDGGAGLLIHGWPPCNGQRCLVVSPGWERLLRALAGEGRGSIRVV